MSVFPTQTLQINGVAQKLKDNHVVDRRALLDELAQLLTANEASALVARIQERNSTHSKSKRFGLYPIEDWRAFERTKRLEAAHWQADEVEFTDDRHDFNELTLEEQQPLIMAFGFFAVGDGSIASMLAYQMIVTADTFEKQCFYITQLNNERVHGETYGKMIYTLVSDPKKRDEIFNAVENVKSIQRMNQFIENAFTYPQGERQIFASLAASEYIMFTPLFCIIFWYRAYKKGKLRHIVFSNEQIAKDECAHCENGCDNYRALSADKKYSDDEIHGYIDQVVTLVSDFADEVLSTINLPELTPANVKQYIRYVADDLLDRLDHAKYYKVTNPFVWMDFTNLVPKTNFYEGTVGEYNRFNASEAVKKAYQLCNNTGEEVAAPKVNVYKKTNKIRF